MKETFPQNPSEILIFHKITCEPFQNKKNQGMKYYD